MKKVRRHNSICLCQIVKNESKVIERCLTSVAPLIDYWVISDTGSIDGTQNIICEFFKKHNIKGELHQHEWKNFAHNRSLAMRLAREKSKCDYIITLDADEIFEYPDNWNMPKLTLDTYLIMTKTGIFEYGRHQFFNAKYDWYYKDVLHEYPHTNDIHPLKQDYLPDIYNRPHSDGARSSDPNKYRKDALILEKAILDEPKNSRYYFYLAQSYRDCNDYDNAIKYYQIRFEQKGFVEETFYTKYEIGLCKKRRGDKFNDYVGDLLEAYNFLPTRLESVYIIVNECRNHGKSFLAWNLFKHLLEKPIETRHGLFVQRDIYDYKLLDELSISAYWAGEYQASKEIIERIFTEKKYPSDLEAYFQRNHKFANDALAKQGEEKKKEKQEKTITTMVKANPTNITNPTTKITENQTSEINRLLGAKVLELNTALQVEREKLGKMEKELEELRLWKKQRLEMEANVKAMSNLDIEKQNNISINVNNCDVIGKPFQTLEQIFKKIIVENKWGYKTQRYVISTGSGNSEIASRPCREHLSRYLKLNHIRTVADVGCGIWEFEHTEFDDVIYFGIDCVLACSVFNREYYGRENRYFIYADVLTEGVNLPETGVDLVFIKDVLQHLSNKTGETMIDKLRMRCKYLLLVNDYAKNGVGLDIAEGSYRPISRNHPPLAKYLSPTNGVGTGARGLYCLARYGTKEICLIYGDKAGEEDVFVS